MRLARLRLIGAAIVATAALSIGPATAQAAPQYPVPYAAFIQLSELATRLPCPPPLTLP